MKPIEFKEQNIVFAKDQPQYLPLPALRNEEGMGEVISCWKFSFTERLRILFTGKLWSSLAMFGRPLTPQFYTTKKSDVIAIEKASWLFILNYYFLQFLFIRLYKSIDSESKKVEGYGFVYGVWPMSGWKNSYKPIGKKVNFTKIWFTT